jgi:hypothetical protein
MKCKQCENYRSVLRCVYDALFSSTEPWLVDARKIIRAVLDGVTK